jgi:hypothetical protein
MEHTHRNTEGRSANRRDDAQPEFEIQESVSEDGRSYVRKVIWTTRKPISEVTALLERAKKAVGASSPTLSATPTTV